MATVTLTQADSPAPVLVADLNVKSLAVQRAGGVSYAFYYAPGKEIRFLKTENGSTGDYQVRLKNGDSVVGSNSPLACTMYHGSGESEDLRLYYIDDGRNLKELCPVDGRWVHGGLSAKNYKVSENSGLGAAGTRELQPPSSSDTQLEVYFMDDDKPFAVSKAYNKGGEWNKELLGE